MEDNSVGNWAKIAVAVILLLLGLFTEAPGLIEDAVYLAADAVGSRPAPGVSFGSHFDVGK